MRPHYLNTLFKPRSIAMFGASDREESVGQVVFKNLLEGGFKGAIYPINPKHKKVQGHKAHKNLDSITEQIDLAVIATPAKTVPAIIESCGEHGVKSAIILSAGFREIGARGQRLETKVLDIAKSYNIHILGPNCLGLIRPEHGLNATFGKGKAHSGDLALVSQSGAICTAVMDWADQNSIGFSAVVSTGISADLDFGNILDFLVNDPKTKSILLYIEGLHDARHFMSGLRAVARIKPIIAIKVGRHSEGAGASMSHTGALVGDDDVFSAALARSGVVRIKFLSQLCAAARVLSSRYKGCGENMVIITNGGGPGVLAADRAADLNLNLATLGEETVKKLNKLLPQTWSHSNPIDIIGDASAVRYKETLEICLEDPAIDGAIVILTPQAMTHPEQVAQAIIEVAGNSKKPILTSWMGGTQVESARKLLAEADIPNYPTPETTIDAYHFLTAYEANQNLLLQTPSKASRSLKKPANVDAARLIIESALSRKHKTLTEPESIAILKAFHIPTVHNGVAHSADEALIIATSMEFPIAMKINSVDVVHKTDVGGVRLNISDAHSVRQTYKELVDHVQEQCPDATIDGVIVEQMYSTPNARELMVGIVNDQIFGPVISFGSGGTSVEVINDNAVALPPLNRCLAEDLIDRTNAKKMLGGFRNLPPIDLDALIDVLLRVSSIACELPTIQEMDINPLIVDENGAIAVDASFKVNYAVVSNDRYHHMAIHPYPYHMVHNTQLPDGTNITIRPIRPEDAEIETEFINSLSSEAKYFRFMQGLHQLTASMLVRFTQIDYYQEMALIAVTQVEEQEKELGVARYVINPDKTSCEFALVVTDTRQNQGLGHRLMQQLMEVARHRGLTVMEGEVLSNNHKMLGLMKSLKFSISTDPEDMNIQKVVKRL